MGSLANCIIGAGSLLRLRPFDTSTVAGRSRERYRRILMSALTSLLGRGISIPISLLTVPLTIQYLGTERFGVWMTVSSAVAMLGFLDLGIGQGLLNAVAEADGKQDRARARLCVSSAFCLLFLVAAAVLVLFWVAYPFTPWHRIFNVASQIGRREAGPTAAVLVACFAASLPLSVVRHVQLGHQEGFANDLWNSAGQLLGLGLVLCAIALQAGLPWLVAALAGAPHLASIGNWAVQFGGPRRWLSPAWSLARLDTARELVRTGLCFTGVSLCAAFAVAADNLIIAHALGSEAVAQYAVPFRLFATGSMLLTMLIMPLWPACTEACARGDYAWLRQTTRRALLWGLVAAGVPCAGLVLSGRWMIRLWVGAQIAPGFGLLLA
ncbi:MAG: lipopolysaccharide biosynthesis protein, partial [Acidobacteriota bacterium]